MGLFSTAEKSDKAKFKKIKEEGCLVSFSVEVPAAKVEDETHNCLLRFQQRARLPGFRQGKAPLELVKTHFTAQAHEDVIDRLIRAHVPEALTELKLAPVSVPSVADISFEPGKPAQFSVNVEIAPHIEPKDYIKVAVQKKSYPTTDAALAARLDELREANARLEKSENETVAKGEYAVIDYTASRDGKPLTNLKGQSELIDTSSSQSVEGLIDGLIGLKRGQTKEITVKLDNKDTLLAVTVTEIKKKILPPLDAEFAKDVGFASIDELKAKLKEVMDGEGRTRAEREMMEQIESALLKANPSPLPPSLVDEQLKRTIERARAQILGPKGQWSQKQVEDLKKNMLPKAESDVRLSYIFAAIADKEKIDVKDEDIKAELDQALASAENEERKTELRKMFDERRDAIMGMLRERKVIAYIKEKAVYKDA